MSKELTERQRKAIIQVQLEAIHCLNSGRGKEFLRKALIEALHAIDGTTSTVRSISTLVNIPPSFSELVKTNPS